MEFLEASIFQKGYIDGITILNLDGEILFSAKFNKKLSNLDESQQLIGQKFLDVYPNLTPQLVRCTARCSLEGRSMRRNSI